jgi:NADH:ubiquinone oxidoreductase subunit E
MNQPLTSHRVEVCLGSSCFAKGSSRLATAAAAWARGRPVAVELAGHRCQQQCADGPRVSIDGTEHRVRDERELIALLERLAT